MKGILLTLIFLSFALGHFEIFATTKCPTGQIFNTSLNRCMYTEGSIKNRNDYTECEGIENETEKNACIKRTADTRQQAAINELNEGRVSDSDVNNNGQFNGGFTGFSASLLEAYGLVNGIALVAGKAFDSVDKKLGEQDCMSCTIVSATAAYSFYQSKIQKEDVEKKTDEFKTEYEEYTKNPESMNGAQLEAFNMIEKEQQYLAEVSGKHKKQYRTTAMGYTAATVAAAYDIWKDGGTKCFGEEGSMGRGNWAATMFKNPCVILFGGAVAATASLSVSSAAGQQEKEAEANVAQIKELKEKYIKSVASYCPNGRDSLSEPACYCYTADGKKNPNRQKSNTCIAYWNKYDGSYVSSTDASRAAPNRNPSGCIYKDGKFDRECNCRKLKNNKGENACQSLKVSSGFGTSLGGLDVSEALDLVNQTSQGNAGTYSSSSANQSAITDKALAAVKKKVEAPFKKATGITLDQAANKFAKDLGRSGDNNNVAIFNGSPGEQFARLRPTPPSQFQETIASVESKLPAKGIIASRKTTRTRSKTKNSNRWKFDDSTSSQVLSYGKGADEATSNKKYDLGDNDIIKDKSVSIFKVISHRYVQSGLKKLFSE